jgi:uncharacterized damage-inducible protein DinB
VFRSIADFVFLWSRELESTQKILKHIPDRSLHHSVHPDVRSLGRLAWHIVTTMPEMMEKTGLRLEGVSADAPIPSSSKEILRAYTASAVSILGQIQAGWSDATLDVEDEMYGERWKRRDTLLALVLHQAHHRAQMTVLMRMQGLGVPGLYGPAREEWAGYGMKPPEL